MGIDANDIRVCTWKILKFLMNTCHRCVLKHPLVSGILFSFFFLYNFYPYILRFLINASPVVVCTLVILRIFFNSERPRTQNVEKDDQKRNHEISSKKSGSVEDDLIVDRNENSSLQTQMGVRRNVEEKNKELDDLIDGTAKEIRKRKVNSCLDRGESSYSNAYNFEKVVTFDERHQVLDCEASKADFRSDNGFDEQSDKYNGSGGECEAESPEEDEDEEEAQEDGNKAVEWTEDDQKNLMDLGTSEIERNKRLESLIAKRRARKSMRKQVEKNLIDLEGDTQNQIAPILISRTNLLALPTNSEGTDDLLMPGSAPSVLLPMRNPFDLPYDPLEEKPNLMGDSFQQEFMAAHQKDMFCRHESFCLGPSFPGEPGQDRRDTKFNPFLVTDWKASVGSGYSRFKGWPFERDNEKLAIQAFSQEVEPMFHSENAPDHVEQGGQHPVLVLNSEETNLEDDREIDNSMIKVRGEEKENTHDIDDSSSSLSSSLEVNDDNFNANKGGVSENLEPRMLNFPPVFSNSLQKSLSSCAVPRNTAMMGIDNNGKANEPYYDSSPSAIDNKTRIEEHIFYANKRSNHTPTCSIASDLQVEISEVGSPSLTVDGTISPADAESITYDVDVDREITSGSEEMWGESSHLAGVEENESRSREVHAITEKDIIEVGFSGVNQNSEGPIAPPVLPEQIVEQDSINTSSLPSPRTESPGEGRAYLLDLDQKIHDEAKKVVVEEIQEPLSASSSDALPHETLASPVPEKAENLKEKSVAHPSGGGDSEKLEEPSNPPKKSMGEANIIYNVSDRVVQANEETENLQSIVDQHGEAQLVINHETDEDLSKAADEASSKSIEYIEEYFEKHEEYDKQVKENDNSESNKEFEGAFEKLIEQEDNADEANEGEQGTAESGLSGDSRNSDDLVASAVQPEVVVEQVPIESSSSLSPKSVLPENVPTDQAPSLNFHQVIHVDVQQSAVDDNSLYEMPPENLSLTTPQTVERSSEDSMVLPSNYYGDFEKLLENPSNPPGNSLEEANIIYNVGETVVSEKEDNVKLRSVEDSKNESQLLIRQEAVVEPSKPAKAKDDSRASDETMVDPSKPKEENHSSNIPVTVVEGEELSNPSPGESTVESNIPYHVNESIVSEMNNKENLNSVGDSEDESRRLIDCEDAIDPPKPGKGEDSLEAIEDVKGEANVLIKEDSEVNKSLDHKIVAEPSNTMDSKAGVPNPDTDNSYKEAT